MSCILCNSPDSTVVWDKTEREKQSLLRSVVIRDEAGNILNGTNVQCHRCGLVYVHPGMDKQALDRFYAEGYRKTYGQNNEAQIEAERNHAQNAMTLIRGIKFGKPVKFLDIGCCSGQLLIEMSHVFGGKSVEGIEPDKESSEQAKKNCIKAVVHNTGIESFTVGHKYDLVTMLNTLEHTYNPIEALSKIHSLLSDDGWLIVSVPDLYNTNIKKPVDAYMSNAHLFTFSRHTLRHAMHLQGFDVTGVCIVPEEIGDKIYMVCCKGEVKEWNTPMPPPEATKNFLHAVDYIYDAKVRLYGAL